VHEQLHNNPSLCPVVVTEKVSFCDFVFMKFEIVHTLKTYICLPFSILFYVIQTVDVAAQSAEKVVEKVADAVNGHKETLHAKK